MYKNLQVLLLCAVRVQMLRQAHSTKFIEACERSGILINFEHTLLWCLQYLQVLPNQNECSQVQRCTWILMSLADFANRFTEGLIIIVMSSPTYTG
jgi:hypothetical protein